MISLGANDFDVGLFGACQGGNFETIKYLIKKGATNLSLGFEGACFAGNKEIAILMINLGAPISQMFIQRFGEF